MLAIQFTQIVWIHTWCVASLPWYTAKFSPDVLVCSLNVCHDVPYFFFPKGIKGVHLETVWTIKCVKMQNFNTAMKKVGKFLYKMVAFVLEITEPDCHLLENKYFLKLY